MRRVETPLRLALLVGLVAIATPARAQQEIPADVPWQAELVEVEARDPQTPIRLRLPGWLDADAQARLAVEVDGYDLTALVTRSGRDWIVRPSGPLDWGVHIVRVVEVTPDGGLRERGRFALDIRRTPLFREASARAGLSLDLFQPLSSRNTLGRGSERTEVYGAGRVSARLAEAETSLSARVDWLVDTRDASRDLDLGEFLIAGRTGPLGFKLGEHDLSDAELPPSFVLETFRRRGLSVSLAALDELGVAASGFALRADPLVGLRGGLGISDGDDRVAGAGAMWSPFASRELLRLGAIWLTGRAPLFTSSISGGPDGELRGRAWTGLADGRLGGERVRWRAEYARARSELRGLGAADGRAADRARKLELDLQPLPDLLLGESPVGWRIGLTHEEIGPDFQSLGNPTLPSDRRVSGARSEWLWSSWSLDLAGRRENNNLDDRALVPKIDARIWHAQLRYRPVDLPEWLRAARWFGTPELRARFGGVRRVQDDVPVELRAFETDLDVRTRELAGTLHYDWGSVGALFYEADEDDRALANFDTRDRNVSGFAHLSFGRRGWASLVVERDSFRERALGLVTRTWLVTGDLGFEIWRDRLDADLGMSWQRTRSNDRSQDRSFTSIRVGTRYTALQAQGNRPGLVLGVQTTWNLNRDDVNPVFDRSQFNAWLTASLVWEAGW